MGSSYEREKRHSPSNRPALAARYLGKGRRLPSDVAGGATPSPSGNDATSSNPRMIIAPGWTEITIRQARRQGKAWLAGHRIRAIMRPPSPGNP